MGSEGQDILCGATTFRISIDSKQATLSSVTGLVNQAWLHLKKGHHVWQFSLPIEHGMKWNLQDLSIVIPEVHVRYFYTWAKR